MGVKEAPTLLPAGMVFDSPPLVETGALVGATVEGLAGEEAAGGEPVNEELASD